MTFQAMVTEFPDHPAGYLCMAGLMESRMIIEHHNRHEKAMYALIDRCLKQCDVQEKKGNRALAHFFRGGALGYRGMHRARRKEWFRAFKDGAAGEKQLRLAVEIDPNVFDAYYGLGLYDYYRSKYAKTFAWLPFFADRREEGIEELRLSMEKGLFTAAAARVATMWILLEENRFDEAETLAVWMMENYPPYWDSYNLMATLKEEQGEIDEAISYLEKLVSTIETRAPANEYDRYRFLLRLGDTLYERDRREQAQPVYQRIATWEPSVSRDETREVSGWIRRAKSRLRRIERSN